MFGVDGPISPKFRTFRIALLCTSSLLVYPRKFPLQRFPNTAVQLLRARLSHGSYSTPAHHTPQHTHRNNGKFEKFKFQAAIDRALRKHTSGFFSTASRLSVQDDLSNIAATEKHIERLIRMVEAASDPGLGGLGNEGDQHRCAEGASDCSRKIYQRW